MDRISRRQIVRGAAATAVATSLGTPSVHAQKNRQILRFVPHAELKILDYITRNHCYLVYDTLFVTSGNQASRLFMCGTLTTSRAMSRRADQQAARGRTSTRSSGGLWPTLVLSRLHVSCGSLTEVGRN
jgi:hypothetical protein